MQHRAVDAFLVELMALGWVRDVWLYGSLASGDHRPGASDIDLVAVTGRVLGRVEVGTVRRIH
ncbi:nucleotidyltransferase domain-containing protein [Nocardioides sp. SYSU D00065]|uniref:nucleotidyltransferase domain-containing protein n=1 Tax=Nocardioides sp. SYSU D00065 TaxID=2817378 RepID=UPI001B3198A3|nr:nucleotidyltransferase domain-containing protein [Nocardioides sp. SYSU D00065]